MPAPNCPGVPTVPRGLLSLNRMSDDDDQMPIEIRWQGDQIEGVFVAADWRQSLTPTELIARAAGQFRERRRGGASWRSRVRLRGIPLNRMDDFVDAVRAARRESPVLEVNERSTRHFSSRWRGGDLLNLSGDVAWLDGAKRQEVADELLEILDVPADEEGPAVAWLMRMMGETSR